MSDKLHKEALAKASEGLAPKIVKIAEELTCELTDDEWNDRAHDLAEAHKHVAREEERKKNVMGGINNDIKIAKAKESKLADIVAARQEQREVTVEVKYDYELGRVSKTRTDTGEVISDREMTDQERQAELDLLHDANDVIEDVRNAERKADEEAENAPDPRDEPVQEGGGKDDTEPEDDDLGEGDLPEETGDAEGSESDDEGWGELDDPEEDDDERR